MFENDLLEKYPAENDHCGIEWINEELDILAQGISSHKVRRVLVWQATLIVLLRERYRDTGGTRRNMHFMRPASG